MNFKADGHGKCEHCGTEEVDLCCIPDYMWVCKDCLETWMTECDRCGRIWDIDVMTYTDDGEELCPYCADEE